MSQDQTIDIAELRALSDRLFRRLEQSGASQVSVTSPHYWTIFADEAFSLDQPPELVLGDVRDDLHDVRKAAGETDEAVIFWHAFHHLSGLMLFLAKADMQNELAGEAAAGGAQ